MEPQFSFFIVAVTDFVEWPWINWFKIVIFLVLGWRLETPKWKICYDQCEKCDLDLLSMSANVMLLVQKLRLIKLLKKCIAAISSRVRPPYRKNLIDHFGASGKIAPAQTFVVTLNVWFSLQLLWLKINFIKTESKTAFHVVCDESAMLKIITLKFYLKNCFDVGCGSIKRTAGD